MMCSRVEPDVHCRKNLQKSVVGPINEDGCSHITLLSYTRIYSFRSYHCLALLPMTKMSELIHSLKLSAKCKNSKYVSILKYK